MNDWYRIPYSTFISLHFEEIRHHLCGIYRLSFTFTMVQNEEK